MARTRWIRISLTAAIIVGAVWAGGFFYFIDRIAAMHPDAAGQTDGIVALTGGRDRLAIGLDLLRRGFGQRLLISGVDARIDNPQLQKVLGLEPSALSADGKPIPARPEPATHKGADLFDCCIDAGRSATDTVGNATEIAVWARGHGYRSVRVVTGAYHMPRSLVEIRRAAPELELVPHPVFTDNVRIDKWWTYTGTTRVLASEYNKYLVSLVRAWLVAMNTEGQQR